MQDPLVPCCFDQSPETDATDCLVLHPTAEQFKLGLRGYLQAHVATNPRFREEGVVKVVAPKEFADFRNINDSLRELTVKPTEQVPLGRSGVVTLAMRDCVPQQLPLVKFIEWGNQNSGSLSRKIHQCFLARCAPCKPASTICLVCLFHHRSLRAVEKDRKEVLVDTDNLIDPSKVCIRSDWNPIWLPESRGVELGSLGHRAGLAGPRHPWHQPIDAVHWNLEIIICLAQGRR